MDWRSPQTLTFEPLDQAAFPAVGLARAAGIAGGTAPAAYNAANEEAVAAFLAGHLPFLSIVDTIAEVLDRLPLRERPTVADVLDVESEARRLARERIGVAA
jgi:1-deoxy-D-xylulose-5-phosphate reductoisomerase